MFFKQILIFFSFGLIPMSQIIATNPTPPVSQTQEENNSRSRKRPAPPKRIPPNKVKPGGGLDPSRQSCTKNNESLTALIPIENPVLTTKAYPSFLFYIPDPAIAIDRGEFAIFTANEKTRIYATTIILEPTQTPGILKIDIPESAQYALQPETYYHWYFRVYCQNSANERESLDVNGWIKNVTLTPARKREIATASPDLWYDAIAESLENPLMRDRWIKLLRQIDLEHLTDYPVIQTSDRAERETEQINPRD